MSSAPRRNRSASPAMASKSTVANCRSSASRSATASPAFGSPDARSASFAGPSAASTCPTATLTSPTLSAIVPAPAAISFAPAPRRPVPACSSVMPVAKSAAPLRTCPVPSTSSVPPSFSSPMPSVACPIPALRNPACVPASPIARRASCTCPTSMPGTGPGARPSSAPSAVHAADGPMPAHPRYAAPAISGRMRSRDNSVRRMPPFRGAMLFNVSPRPRISGRYADGRRVLLCDARPSARRRSSNGTPWGHPTGRRKARNRDI